MATATRMTAEQYYAVTVEGDRAQLVEGELVVNQPKSRHALLQSRLNAALTVWTSDGEARGMTLAPTDIRMDEHNVYGPDVIWFAHGHEPDLDAYPDRVPDLCIEIRSPGTWRYDIGPKKRVYEDGGLPELWLVDGETATVLVYRRSTPETSTFDVMLELGVADALTSPQLPGFELNLSELFRGTRHA